MAFSENTVLRDTVGRFGFRGDKKREAEFKAFFGKDLNWLAR